MNIKSSNKLLKCFSAAMIAATIITPTSVSAASSSGNTSGSVTNTINTSPCTGTQQVSGMDAVVFAKITPDHAGTIVCSKSDGFKTTITGANNVNNYHWVAWYKEKLKDKVDTTLENGNYSGFSKDKVAAWKQYEAEVRELNNGKFPSNKDYYYPTDTQNGKLDFWGDLAGYYSILGDPRYSSIHLESYQQFSYRVEDKDEFGYWWIDPNYVPPTPSGGGNTGDDGGNSNSGGGSMDDKKITCKENPNQKKCKKDPVSNQPVCDNGNPTWFCMTYNGGPGYCNPNVLGTDRCNTGGSSSGSSSSSSTTTPSTGNSSWPGGPGYHDVRSSERTYDKGNGWRYTVRTTIYSYNETKLVKVADATVAANAYATEIAAYGKLHLVPNANSTKSYDVGTSGFWKTKPSYWTDGGKLVINNNGNYNYGYVRESENSNGVNKINLYKSIIQKDKLYDVVHGYKFIPDDVCKTRCHPADDGDDDDKNDETPPANIVIEIDKDEPQSETELKKFVHLDKSPD